ncbi:MAG: DUF4358 domain-containing protein [Lachnospiraceae bacterium]|nr:DUF4358 domain-containing protein [Lachnospiraceae bacterium]MDY5869805.1 DUF4358 domain-containing protein [Lachnospiraceae bacterium]
MKKEILLGIALFTTLLMTGCIKSDTQERSVEDQAYVNEGNGEEDAVNTLQTGAKYKVTGTMDVLRSTVIQLLGENYWPDTLLSAEELAERVGISENMYESFLAEYQHTEAGIDTMILIEAKENEVETVEKCLNDYREVLLNIYEQQPQNEAKVFASRIEVIDHYVCYVQLGADISFLEEKGREEMVAYCQQENERALDVLEKRILGA